MSPAVIEQIIAAVQAELAPLQQRLAQVEAELAQLRDDRKELAKLATLVGGLAKGLAGMSTIVGRTPDQAKLGEALGAAVAGRLKPMADRLSALERRQ